MAGFTSTTLQPTAQQRMQLPVLANVCMVWPSTQHQSCCVLSMSSSSVYRVSFAPPTSAVAVTFAQFAQNIAFNSAGDAFITAYSTGRVFKWNGAGAPVAWNTGSAFPVAGIIATNVQFGAPVAIAIDATGNMLLGEVTSCRVWLVDAQTLQLKLVAGSICGSTLDSGNPTQTQLYGIAAVAFGPGARSVYIADPGNHRILKVVLECVGA
jgi:hypothetical protein